MVTGWRRAFCTSIPKERDKQTTTKSPRFGSRFTFFSNPSTPRFQSDPVSTPTLRCLSTTTTPTSSSPTSPKLQCKTQLTHKKSKIPGFFNFSNPSSPKSPSTFSFLKPSFRHRCGICLHTVNSAHQQSSIFTAECSHTFHLPCISSYATKQPPLLCPVCSCQWKDRPSVPPHSNETQVIKQQVAQPAIGKHLRVYDDDEPLRSPSPGSVFNPIPESNENDEEGEITEFQGFLLHHPTPLTSSHKPTIDEICRNIEITLLAESAILTSNRSHQTYAVMLKVKTPAHTETRGMRRAPIDLVTLLDVSGKMSAQKLQMMKRAMRLVISSLSSTDRLSIIAFSSTSKRLLQFRRMTSQGRRSARMIVEAMISTSQGGMSVNDALKKAAKVFEDRRERNPVSTIIVFSDGPQDHKSAIHHCRLSPFPVLSKRFGSSEIPVHAVCFGDTGGDSTTALANCIGGLLNVVVQDLRLELGFVSGSAPAQITAVYSTPARRGGSNLITGSDRSVRLGELYAGEERNLLVEFKVPLQSASRSHNYMTVQSSFVDPSSRAFINASEQMLLVPRLQSSSRSTSGGSQRLKSLHVTTRAIVESRQLIDNNDLSGAYQLLSSARTMLMKKSNDSSAMCGLEAELAEAQRRMQQSREKLQERGGEPLTPTSAWRAAERLAKVAVMRKHMNRVSDLHGFENARF